MSMHCNKMEIAIFFASLLAFANTLDCDLEFSCNANDDISYTIYGTKFTCKNGLVCNREKKTSCDPCIEKPPSCPFKCNGDSVDINGMLVNCKNQFVCNQSPEEDCTMCVRRKCDSEIIHFTCDEKDDALVTIGKYTVSCGKGYKCNAEHVQPCDPCITRDDKLLQPFVQNTNIISTDRLPIIQPRAISVPDEDMVNCNDGRSFLQPCRPGAAGANYYFKCILTWNLRYSTSIKPCTSLYSDKRCRIVQDLCLPAE